MAHPKRDRMNVEEAIELFGDVPPYPKDQIPLPAVTGHGLSNGAILVTYEQENSMEELLKKGQGVIVPFNGEETRGVIYYVSPTTIFISNKDEPSAREVRFIAVEINGWAIPFFNTDIMHYVDKSGKIIQDPN